MSHLLFRFLQTEDPSGVAIDCGPTNCFIILINAAALNGHDQTKLTEPF
ncbi:hypothetical protein BH09BAC6_BH09BAC6_23610 [soil metagenome]|jgi:hypothetical protein